MEVIIPQLATAVQGSSRMLTQRHMKILIRLVLPKLVGFFSLLILSVLYFQLKALLEFANDVDPNLIRITEVIGSGEFGEVCKGVLQPSPKIAAYDFQQVCNSHLTVIYVFSNANSISLGKNYCHKNTEAGKQRQGEG